MAPGLGAQRERGHRCPSKLMRLSRGDGVLALGELSSLVDGRGDRPLVIDQPDAGPDLRVPMRGRIRGRRTLIY